MLTPALTHGFFAIFLTSFTHTFLRFFPVVFFFSQAALRPAGGGLSFMSFTAKEYTPYLRNARRVQAGGTE
jgi:hypothetical protein